MKTRLSLVALLDLNLFPDRRTEVATWGPALEEAGITLSIVGATAEDTEEASHLLGSAHGVLVGTKQTSLLERSLTAAVTPKLQWVHTISAGADQLPLADLDARGGGITVTHHSGLSSGPLAEFALAAVGHFAKGLGDLACNHSNRLWERPPRGLSPRQLSDMTVGIVGCGSIGRAVARIAKGYGMHTIGLTRTARGNNADGSAGAIANVDTVVSVEAGVQGLDCDGHGMDGDGGTNTGLHYLLERSDLVVLCMPHTADTTATIGVNELQLFRPDAVLVNVGRGSAIDEEALCAVLGSKPREEIGEKRGLCAALDVFCQEPLPVHHPFWEISPDRLIISPHAMDQTDRYWVGAAEAWAQNALIFSNASGDIHAAIANGLGPVVDLKTGY